MLSITTTCHGLYYKNRGLVYTGIAITVKRVTFFNCPK